VKKIYIENIEEGGVKEYKMKKKNSQNTSVIIRTRNEERWIGHAIQSVLDNLKKPEIIIVDNFSNDETLNIVKSFIADPMLQNENKGKTKYTNIKIYQLKDYSPGKFLNFGIKKAKFNNVMVMSAHCILKKINIEQTIANLKKYVAVFGNQIPVWKGKKITKRYIWSHFSNVKTINMYSKMEKRYFFHNAAAFFNKSFMLKNRFDEYLHSKEDRYWANKIVKKRKKYLYDPEFCVEHQYTDAGNTWKGIG
tara:strand:+ start:3537 stop:4286 length:750 start_codon:yes stop_codon:yes gene_type:complete